MIEIFRVKFKGYEIFVPKSKGSENFRNENKGHENFSWSLKIYYKRVSGVKKDFP